MRRWIRALTLLAALGAAAPLGAQAPEPSPEPEFPLHALKAEPPPEGDLSFSHRIHCSPKLKTSCTDCHRLGVDGNRFRPSEPTMCRQCHVGDQLVPTFYDARSRRPARARTGPLEPIHQQHIYYKCERCHGNMELSEKIGDFPLPPTHNSEEVCVKCHARAVTFSHARHVAIGGKVVADCEVCHKPRPEGIWFSNPGHPECWQCHDITLLGLTEGCNLCHLRDPRAPKTYNIERASTLHKEHPRPRVACESCHASILTATSLEELREAREQASKSVCTRCHVVPK